MRGLEALPPEIAETVTESKLPEPGQQSSGSYEGDGYVILRHRDTAAVASAMRQIVSTVRVELG